MINEINSIYLEKWKDFPGPNIIKYAFALIGALSWYEFFVPEFKFTNHLLWGMIESGNVILAVLAISGAFGVIACAIVFFPTYLHSILKVLSK